MKSGRIADETCFTTREIYEWRRQQCQITVDIAAFYFRKCTDVRNKFLIRSNTTADVL